MRGRDGAAQGKDDDMCTLNLSFSAFPAGQVIDNQYDMTSCKQKKSAANLHLTINIVPAGTPAFSNLGGYQQGGYPPRGYPPC